MRTLLSIGLGTILLGGTACTTDSTDALNTAASALSGQSSTTVAGDQENADRPATLRGGPSGGRGGPALNLSDEQRAQLDALRAQVEAGEITPEEAHDSAREIIGESGMMPPGGPGEFGRQPGPGGRVFAELNLTDEQRTQAEAIREQAHADIKALHEAARAETRALLTEEQQALFDELPPPGPPHGPGGRGPGHPPEGENPMLDRLTEELGLSAEQQAAIGTIMETTHTNIKARHDQAREAFRAILTEEQLAKLDEFEAKHPRR